MNIHIHCYGDYIVKDAIRSVPPDLATHVLDGRIAGFPQLNDSDLTPGLESWCADYPDVKYHAPPEHRLPFGDPDSIDPNHRTDRYDKGTWAQYDVLPSDEWTFKLDADEYIVEFQIDRDLIPGKRYFPHIKFYGPEQPILPRLWIPKYWTFYTSDCAVPREAVPRDLSPSDTRAAASIWLDNDGPAKDDPEQFKLPNVKVVNDMSRYSDEYVNARATHLQRTGDPERAAKYSESVSDDQT